MKFNVNLFYVTFSISVVVSRLYSMNYHLISSHKNFDIKAILLKASECQVFNDLEFNITPMADYTQG
jgi:hypothetical protein